MGKTRGFPRKQLDKKEIPTLIDVRNGISGGIGGGSDGMSARRHAGVLAVPNFFIEAFLGGLGANVRSGSARFLYN
jgi:hypothetical protein